MSLEKINIFLLSRCVFFFENQVTDVSLFAQLVLNQPIDVSTIFACSAPSAVPNSRYIYTRV